MTKKTLAIFAFILILPATGLALNGLKKTYPTVISAKVVADLSDERLLVGVAQNVFVAKVSTPLSEERDGIFPEALFLAEVKTNLKGDLSGRVIISQLPEGDVFFESGNTYGPGGLLQPGSTYLFSTLHDPEKDRHTLEEHWAQ